MNLCEYEINLLRLMAGEDVPDMQWGAAMGACLGFLKGSGLVRSVGGKYEITDKGRKVLNDQPMDSLVKIG